jgi:predicted alpha/beta-fold hydrolase
MTIAAAFLPRQFRALPRHESRIVKVARDAMVRLDCHWQADRAAAPAVVLVHGLEGSSESHYMLGTAEKAWRAGFSRRCG